jgi:hypothetical protein
MNSIGLPELFLILPISLIGIALVWPTVRICRRAGFPGWLGLIAILPIANVLLLWFLAWAPWPALKPARS